MKLRIHAELKVGCLVLECHLDDSIVTTSLSPVPDQLRFMTPTLTLDSCLQSLALSL